MLGEHRAWRAPGNQQASFLTCCAIEDFAAKVGKDPLEVFKLNAQYAPPARVENYRYQLDKAAELAEWGKLWKPRGRTPGTLKRGLGIGIAAWNGAGHAGQCRCIINPDGSVTIEIGTQDLGTGTYTVMTQIAADALGIPAEKVHFELGDTLMPPAGVSGGSTTVASVGPAVQAACVAAREKKAAAVAAGRPHEIVEAQGSSKEGEEKKKFAARSFGAVFVEVRVDEELGRVSVPRVSRVCSVLKTRSCS